MYQKLKKSRDFEKEMYENVLLEFNTKQNVSED